MPNLSKHINRISFSSDLTLRWRKFDHQFIFYVEQSAMTHVMDEVSANLLLCIYKNPFKRGNLIKLLESMDVVERGEEVESFLDASLLSFQKLGLINLD